MARMFPRELLNADVKTESERRVFEILERDLPDDWEAYHSSGWVLRDEHEGAVDGEIDFVLCHPEQGILCLEVKGHGIECQNGQWYRLEPGGGRKRIKDPFAQALDHRYDLERKIKRDAGRSDLLIGHSVAFPMITIHQLALAPDAPRKLLIDRHDLEHAEASIERVLDFHRGDQDRRKPPGKRGARMLRDLLAPEVRVEVPMAAQFLEEEEALVTLTHEQSLLLNRMRRDRRMVVTGCAGSGKTMLGVEHAKRLARDGERVLFVCFNNALMRHLRDREHVEELEFFTFHGLCVHRARRARLELPPEPWDEQPQEFWREELPERLVEATDVLEEYYDAIVVDEAQDLEGHWLDALMFTLADEQEGSVWLFMDDNQRVYESSLAVPPEFRPFDLTVNCRNTQAIHREVVKLYKGAVVPEVKGPPGRDVELHPTDDPARTVAGVLERLCGREEVAPQDVVVLSSHGYDKSGVARDLEGRWRPTRERGKHGKNVYCSSIRAFKGLESPVVVLCELEDLDDMTQSQQLYVAISRAKNHCVVVAPGQHD